jgi:hypothetical protein
MGIKDRIKANLNKARDHADAAIETANARMNKAATTPAQIVRSKAGPQAQSSRVVRSTQPKNESVTRSAGRPIVGGGRS